MFRISYMVDDKHLAEALRRVQGVGIKGTLLCDPVINAEVRNGKMKARSGGKGYELLATWMRDNNVTEITGSEAKRAFTDMGIPTSSYTHYLNRAVEAGLLKRLRSTKGSNTSRFSLVTVKQ